MKKTYITPVTDICQMDAEQMVAASITGVGGDVANDLVIGDESETPTEADVKEDGNFFGESIFE